ncbi:MAG: hypothetical protein JJE25_10320 [Bacteroidia bacterium]|nr:hypothetical protein [Bacteroidia bacterium]
MILISISFSLLALVAGMFLLDKTKKEGLGKFYNFISWLVIIASLLTLMSSLTRGVIRMSCQHHMERSMEMCHPGMMGGGDCCMPMRGHRMGMMRDGCCEDKMGRGKTHGGYGDMEDDDDDDDDAGMKKEIRIEKDTIKK